MPEPEMHASPEMATTPDVEESEIKAAVKAILPAKGEIKTSVVKYENEYQRYKAITRDSVGKLLKLEAFCGCEELSAINFIKQNKSCLDKTKEISFQIKRLLEEVDIYSNELDDFLETKEYLITTPLARLNKHPKFIKTYNNDISNALKKLSAPSSLNKAQPRDLNSTLSKQGQPSDGLEVLSVVKKKSNLPPLGDFKRKEIMAGDKVYAMKQSLVGEFGIGIVLTIRISRETSETLYKIKFENAKTTSLKLFTAKQLAYTTPSDVILPVGTRICAYYNDGIRKSVYAGVIAEPPKINNNERYLIFYDDGYAQYGNHEDIFPMCAQSPDVADDVHENLKEFIRAYLLKYPERPMVKLQKNQITKTEYECKWWDTKVLEIDASMVKMFFMDSRRTEWIYRGSTRLHILYNELSNAAASQLSGNKKTKHNIVPRKPHQPYVEYTRAEEVVTIDSDDSDSEATSNNNQANQNKVTFREIALKKDSEKPRNTARKSTAPKNRASGINNERLTGAHPDIKSHLGFKEFHCMVNFTSKPFTAHKCSFLCREKENPVRQKGKNPLMIPIILGWERKISYDSTGDYAKVLREKKKKKKRKAFLVQKIKASATLKYKALLEQRKETSLEQNNNTSLEQRNKISLEQKNTTSLEQKNRTSLEQKNRASLEQKNRASLEQKNRPSREQKNRALREQKNRTLRKQKNRTLREQKNRTLREQKNRSLREQENRTLREQKTRTLREQKNRTLREQKNRTLRGQENKTSLEKKNKTRNVQKVVRKYQGKNRCRIMYRSPCGIHLRSIEEVSMYLTKVSSRIPIDFFSVDPQLLVFRTFRAKEILYESKDITGGKENVPVACVNSWSNKPPPFVEYEPQRFPGKNVNLNLDPEFLCGCTCTDNCKTPEKCECQQITYYAMTGQKGGVAGYQHRRLKEPIITGLYECNQRCKCNSLCGNRVVQNGLQVRLQMFKTERKGWGIRCLDDLDAGQFICIYAGQLLTDQGADEDGNLFGDEYLAELDHIEVAEKTKEGYEEDVSDIEKTLNMRDEKASVSDDEAFDPGASCSDENDSDFEPKLRSTATTCLTTRSSKKKSLVPTNPKRSTSNKRSVKNRSLPDISNSSVASKPKSVARKSGNSKVNSKPSKKKRKIARKPKYKSIRHYYGEESCYIMDAKSKGNIGRYLNHSCAPNVFVQNVFVDTHDLRFPAIAFFSMHFIIAGTELTWDYNYEVGTVVGKVMYCYCDTRHCRGRLL